MRIASARSALLLSLSTAISLLSGCGKDPPATQNPTAAPQASSASSPDKPRAPIVAPERSGGALMRSADGARLYLADEDHKTLRVLPIPFGPEPEAPGAAPSASTPPAPSAPPSASAVASSPASRVGPKPPSTPSSLPSAPPSSTAPARPPPPMARQEAVPMPGAPAQVLPLDGLVLVTIRDPGLLLVMQEKPDHKLEEKARIPLPADAWGLAVTKDEKVAVITSAWTHKVTGVEVQSGKVLWTTDVSREPRAIAIHPTSNATYISHLTSGDLTRIDGITSGEPKVSTIAFPAAPMRTPQGHPVAGSLGYALVMSDDGHRLLASRHALGALANWSWFGVGTVDVLQTQNDKPLLAPRVPKNRIRATPAFEETKKWALENFSKEDYRVKQFTEPSLGSAGVVQPRAMIVAHKTKTLWIASEGEDSVAEFPLMAAAPSEHPLRTIRVGRDYEDAKIFGIGDSGIPAECGAPTGLALSQDETRLYVFCRSTYDVAALRIDDPPKKEGSAAPPPKPVITRVASEPIDEAVSRGRRLFYGARDFYSSGGMGCAGCHPEGRDDGHVWHEVIRDEAKHLGNFLATQNLEDKTKDGKLGYARQTPMLAGRVNASGPYGWHAQNETLLERLAEGFVRHRWTSWRGDEPQPKHWMTGERANALVPFLRKGLVPPPKIQRELSAEEKRGKEVFESPETLCVQCHSPETEFTARIAFPMPKTPEPPGFEEEEDRKFKAPSLLFVGGTAPYYHDGSAPTLQALIFRNNDRMGKTNHLSESDKKALVAYLETL